MVHRLVARAARRVQARSQTTRSWTSTDMIGWTHPSRRGRLGRQPPAVSVNVANVTRGSRTERTFWMGIASGVFSPVLGRGCGNLAFRSSWPLYPLRREKKSQVFRSMKWSKPGNCHILYVGRSRSPTLESARGTTGHSGRCIGQAVRCPGFCCFGLSGRLANVHNNEHDNQRAVDSGDGAALVDQTVLTSPLAASVRRKPLAGAQNREWEGRGFFEISAMECKKVQPMKSFGDRGPVPRIGHPRRCIGNPRRCHWAMVFWPFRPDCGLDAELARIRA